MFTFATEWHGSYSRSWLEGNPARKNLVSSHTLALGIRLEAGLDDLRAAAGSTTILRVPVHVAVHLAKTGVVGIVLHPEALLKEMVASDDGLGDLRDRGSVVFLHVLRDLVGLGQDCSFSLLLRLLLLSGKRLSRLPDPCLLRCKLCLGLLLR